MPAGEAGLLALYGVVSRSDVATAGDISVLGDGTIVGARYIRPFGGSDGLFQSLTLGADYKDFDETVRLAGAGNVATPIDYFNFMAEYRATVLGETTRSVAFAGVDFGVRGLGNTEREFENKRFQGEPNYVHLGLGLEHTQTFASDIQAFLGLEAQFAGGPLVSNEQFGIGGVDSVRGYFESEHLGDDGVQGRLELVSPSVARWMSGTLQELRFFAFADGAKVRVQDPLPGDRSFDDLSSVGMGMRLRSLGGFSAGLHWAWPLQETDAVEKGDDRLHFQMEYEM
jgi:hemolysin activation/secretion protein